jgi:hypothetical protein
MSGAYNAAAWRSRRERHLAVNTLMYAVLIAFEQQHLAHHIAELRRPDGAKALTTADGLADDAPAVAVTLLTATEIAA